ncbi:early nodulin-like protein 18 [Magnolia sinica]|uniref:early nodulin-like protein 18 n=1 Tax=Magnolia sinica TaxID=86752 RepID=UPI00265B43D2|nr:early nodulin-like protein 18 [Magnolia sinica]
MEHRTCTGVVFLSLCSCLVILCCFSGGAAAYQNYTVGDSLGWFDNLKEPKINYKKWVSGKNFSLGDFLIFNTDKNHSVIQTYNVTTYRRCDYDNSEEDDTIDWSAGEPTFSAQPVTVEVPLLKEGMVYFFSSNYDGEQCKHGQHFKINVTHGQGLPNSLKSPSTESQGPTGQAADDDSVPDTVIPSNFNNPVDGGGGVKGTSGSVSLSRFLRSRGGILNAIGVMLGVCLGVFW